MKNKKFFNSPFNGCVIRKGSVKVLLRGRRYKEKGHSRHWMIGQHNSRSEIVLYYNISTTSRNPWPYDPQYLMLKKSSNLAILDPQYYQNPNEGPAPFIMGRDHVFQFIQLLVKNKRMPSCVVE